MGARSAGICRAQMNKYPSRWLRTAEVADSSLIPLMHPQIVGFTKPFRGLCALVRRCMNTYPKREQHDCEADLCQDALSHTWLDPVVLAKA